MAGPLTLEIEGFKSIGKLRMELGDLTILLGPPASGKTNVLEALALLGYLATHTIEAETLKALGEEPPPQQPLNKIIRVITCDDLLNKIQLNKKASIRLDNITVELSCSAMNKYKIQADIHAYSSEDSEFRIQVEVNLERTDEWLKELMSSELTSNTARLLELLSLVSSLEKERKPIINVKLFEEELRLDVNYDYLYLNVPRLYNYDRLMVNRNILLGRVSVTWPQHYLLEDASNLAVILYTKSQVYERTNEVLEELTGTRVVPLSSGQLAFFDGKREVGAASVSDTALRVLYYVVALESASPIKAPLEGAFLGENPDKIHYDKHKDYVLRTTVNSVLLLEEPEARVYPLAFTELARVIGEAIERGVRIVLSTHSGELAHLLWEKLAGRHDVRVYYLYREPGELTTVYKVNMDRLAEELETLEIFTTQPPLQLIKQMLESKVLQKVDSEHSLGGLSWGLSGL